MNSIAIDDPLPTKFEEIGEFIWDEAHLANEVIQSEPELPNSLALREALTSPECDQW